MCSLSALWLGLLWVLKNNQRLNGWNWWWDLSTNARTFPRSFTKEVSVSKTWLWEPALWQQMNEDISDLTYLRILHFYGWRKTWSSLFCCLQKAEWHAPTTGVVACCNIERSTFDTATIQQRALVMSPSQDSMTKAKHGNFCRLNGIVR